MNKKEIASNVFWVGKVDNRKVPFHRLILERGTTYNSYLLLTQKPTVIDTVDIAFGKEYVDNLGETVDLQKLSYIVINHVEPDHAGALPALAAKAKNAKIVATSLAVGILKEMFNLHKREFVIVKDGDILDIGGKTLKFIETPYLHTEETMVTYDETDKILFPCDIFSTHIANDELFSDLAKEPYKEDFKTYYDLIMAPHRPYVQKMLNKIEDLDIKVIAPSHGFVLRENARDFINLYEKWSTLDNKNKDRSVTIAYSTMTGNTTKIAKSMAEGLEEAGVKATLLNLKNSSLDEAMESIAQSDGVLIGSSTKYGDMVGSTEDLLKVLKGAKSKPAAAFGSYGWSGEAIFHIENYLKEAGYDVIDRNYLLSSQGVDTPLFPLRTRFASEQALDLARQAGEAFGEIVLNHNN